MGAGLVVPAILTHCRCCSSSATVPYQPDQRNLAVLTIAVARADIVVETQPDCGCDACDSGSSDLLEAVDAAVRHVVGGPFVALRGDKWHAEWHRSGRWERRR